MLTMVYVKNKGWPKLSWLQYRWLALCAVVGVVGYMLCFMWGLSLVSAGRGSLVITFNPVITALGAAIFLRERITPSMLLGMAVATLGALTVITHGDFSRLLSGGVGKGELILLGCSFTWGAYSLMSKRSMQFTDSLTATTYPIVIGTVILLLTGPALDTHLLGHVQKLPLAAVPWTAWLAMVFLAFGATALAYNWFFTGVDQIGATSASAYNTLVPIFGVFFSWLLLGEHMDASLLVGGGIAVLGLTIMNGLASKWLRKK
jgi:drug/metabolite transporter (DMT)-like permease